MKQSLLSLTAAGAFLLAPLCAGAYTSTSEFTTGQDWAERMSEREKYMALVPPAILFSEYDVHTRLGLPQYILLMDEAMERNPHLRSEEVSNIFASTIYLFEPESRPALRTMEIDFLRGDYVNDPLTRPRLTIEDVAPETLTAQS